jgi:hypothetical protein
LQQALISSGARNIDEFKSLHDNLELKIFFISFSRLYFDKILTFFIKNKNAYSKFVKFDLGSNKPA